MNTHSHPQAGAADSGGYRSPSRPPQRRTSPHVEAGPVPAGEPFKTRDGVDVLLRPIHPIDVKALMRAFSRMTPEQVRLRVFHVLTELPEPVARHLCRNDSDKVAAFVVTDADAAEIRGEARVHFDEVTESAEFAIAIDPAFVGRGVGHALMTRLINTSRSRGMREIWGDVLVENAAMLDLGERLHFARKPVPGDLGVVRLTLDLNVAA